MDLIEETIGDRFAIVDVISHDNVHVALLDDENKDDAYFSISHDDGKTWSEPKMFYANYDTRVLNGAYRNGQFTVVLDMQLPYTDYGWCERLGFDFTGEFYSYEYDEWIKIGDFGIERLRRILTCVSEDGINWETYIENYCVDPGHIYYVEEFGFIANAICVTHKVDYKTHCIWSKDGINWGIIELKYKDELKLYKFKLKDVDENAITLTLYSPMFDHRTIRFTPSIEKSTLVLTEEPHEC